MAKTPVVRQYLMLYGRSSSGSVLRSLIKAMDTIKYPTMIPTPPALTIHTRAGRPNNGAKKAKAPRNKMAFVGVLYFG